MRSEKAKMLAGEIYAPGCPELTADSTRAKAWMDRFNARLSMPRAKRQAMLREIFASVGDGAFVRPPFHCDYGYNIHLGRGAFLNFGCVVLDVVEVSIGELTQIGPGVQLLTPDHPRDPEERRQGFEFGRPIRIGRNAWIGGGALVMPGITIGDDAIVGAGAVVTRDVAPGATVGGNPARPLARSAP